MRLDLRFYLNKLDEENKQASAALRTGEFATLQRASQLVGNEVFEYIIYARDVQPIRKAEIQHKKSVVVELIHILKARISAVANVQPLEPLPAKQEPGNYGRLYETHAVGQ